MKTCDNGTLKPLWGSADCAGTELSINMAMSQFC